MLSVTIFIKGVTKGSMTNEKGENVNFYTAVASDHTRFSISKAVYDAFKKNDISDLELSVACSVANGKGKLKLVDVNDFGDLEEVGD